MQVLRLHNVGQLALHDEPIPQPGPGQALIRITAVGICGSDLHWYTDAGIGDARLDHPLVLGHEMAGMVESGRIKGRRVAIDPAVSCHSCEFCLEGNPNFCTNLRFAGHGSQDGSMQEYYCWPEECLYPLPDQISDIEGALLEPLGVAIHAVDLAHLRPGMAVGVFGSGPIGLLILQLARLNGATRLFATDLLPARLEAARGYGAGQVYLADQAREADAILAETGGRGLDVVFEAAGENEAIEAAIAAAKSGGTVILAGIPAEDRTSFTASVARRKGLTIKLVRRMKLTYPRAISLVSSGLIDVNSMVTHCYPLQDFQAAFETASRREGLKIIVQPNQA
jgi:L-iditol 2-dehydrogenase